MSLILGLGLTGMIESLLFENHETFFFQNDFRENVLDVLERIHYQNFLTSNCRVK